MPSLQFLSLFRGPLAKLSMVTSVPLSLLLLGLQEMIDVKFSCPCKLHYNQIIAFLICFAPAIIALVLMLLSLRPFKYEWKYDWTKKFFSKKQNNSGTSQEDNGGTSQGKDNRGTSQSERNEFEEKLSCEKTFIVCLTPSLVWICLWFIDGVYLACGATYWDGDYTCDKERHPNGLNWCKPNEQSQEKTAYEDTKKWIHLSKILGYSLAIFFSLITIWFVSLDCCKSERPTLCRGTDPVSKSHEQEGPGTENQQRIDNPRTGNTENASEDDKLISTTQL